MFLGIIIWGFYSVFILPLVSSNVFAETIANFGVSMIVLILYLFALIITSMVIPKFGKWGDKKIWGS